MVVVGHAANECVEGGLVLCEDEDEETAGGSAGQQVKRRTRRGALCAKVTTLLLSLYRLS
jgi:hypothetical protein